MTPGKRDGKFFMAVFSWAASPEAVGGWGGGGSANGRQMDEAARCSLMRQIWNQGRFHTCRPREADCLLDSVAVKQRRGMRQRNVSQDHAGGQKVRTLTHHRRRKGFPEVTV